MDFRRERDQLGTVDIPANAYYGIHTARAAENFPVSLRPVNMELLRSIVLIKKAAATANGRIGSLEQDKVNAIVKACDEILNGRLQEQFVTDAYQGGAGTSVHMNVNEVLANRALEITGKKKGEYEFVHPLEDVNLHQSTNDVFPTALRMAAIRKLRNLSEAFAELQESIQHKESENDKVLKLARTQLMDAVPMMAGQSFGAYARAISRDRWRLYKVEERLREINLGGTAIGTGINADKKYIFMVTELLQDLTGIGFARSEYPIDTTQNMDVFVEVSGLLKSAAVNLHKMANDLRLLNSGPFGGIGEIRLPVCQSGSSIMPGKNNPVIPEMVAQVSMRVAANDQAITSAALAGQLELNAFVPLIAECLLESMEMMNRAVVLFRDKCVEGIEVRQKQCQKNLDNSAVMVTPLVPLIGFEKASEIVGLCRKEGKSVREVLLQETNLTSEQVDRLLNPLAVTGPGIASSEILRVNGLQEKGE